VCRSDGSSETSTDQPLFAHGTWQGVVTADDRTIIVIPCFNEAARLDVVAFQGALRTDSTLDLLFVDDGSQDATPRLLEDMAAHAPGRVAVVRLDRNSGKAEAVRAGIRAALRPPYGYAGYFDADLATPLGEARRMREGLEDSPECLVIFASRVKLLGFDIRRKPSRHYLGRVAATLISLTCALPVYDTQCGAKLFRVGDAARRVFDEPFLSRWLFDVEILLRCRRERGGKYLEGPLPPVRELPVQSWQDVPGSKVEVWDYARELRDLARIRQHYRALDRARENSSGASI
jgi:dolichyl-phosphate beta-glucosyltransferase